MEQQQSAPPLMSRYGGMETERKYPIEPPLPSVPLMSRSGYGAYPSTPVVIPSMMPPPPVMVQQPMPVIVQQPMPPQVVIPQQIQPSTTFQPTVPSAEVPKEPEHVGIGRRDLTVIYVEQPQHTQMEQQQQQAVVPRKFFKISRVKMIWEFTMANLGEDPLSTESKIPALTSQLNPEAVRQLLTCQYIEPGHSKPHVLIGYASLVATENNSDFSFVARAPWTKKETFLTSSGQSGTFEIPTGNHSFTKDAGVIYTPSSEDQKYIEEQLCSAFVGMSIEDMLKEKRGDAPMVTKIGTSVYVVLDSALGVAIAHAFGQAYEGHKTKIPNTTVDAYVFDDAEFGNVTRLIGFHVEVSSKLCTHVGEMKTSIMFELINPPMPGTTRKISEIVKERVSGLVSPEGEGLQYFLNRMNRIGATFELGYYVFA